MSACARSGLPVGVRENSSRCPRSRKIRPGPARCLPRGARGGTPRVAACVPGSTVNSCPMRPLRRSRSPTTGSPWATASSRRSRSSTGCRSRSRCTSNGSTARLRGLGLPEVDEDAVRRGVAAVLEGTDLPLGRIRITYTGGPAPLGSGRGDAAPTLVVVADAMQRVARDDGGGHRALAAQRARGAGRAQDHVVRRERRRPGRRPRARRERGDLREPRRPPLRGHRLQRLLRRRRRAAHADAGERLPGRRDARA